jgi:hypothetical protein
MLEVVEDEVCQGVKFGRHHTGDARIDLSEWQELPSYSMSTARRGGSNLPASREEITTNGVDTAIAKDDMCWSRMGETVARGISNAGSDSKLLALVVL